MYAVLLSACAVAGGLYFCPWARRKLLAGTSRLAASKTTSTEAAVAPVFNYNMVTLEPKKDFKVTVTGKPTKLAIWEDYSVSIITDTHTFYGTVTQGRYFGPNVPEDIFYKNIDLTLLQVQAFGKPETLRSRLGSFTSVVEFVNSAFVTNNCDYSDDVETE